MILNVFLIILLERLLEIWLGIGKRYRQTDEQMDIHGGKNNTCLPQGETYNSFNFNMQMFKNGVTRSIKKS